MCFLYCLVVKIEKYLNESILKRLMGTGEEYLILKRIDSETDYGQDSFQLWLNDGGMDNVTAKQILGVTIAYRETVPTGFSRNHRINFLEQKVREANEDGHLDLPGLECDLQRN